MKPVYQQLREYREARGITQTHIAKKTGKTVQRISAIETGGIRLTADELVELCLTGYEISPAKFFAEDFLVSENKQADDSRK